MNEEEKNAINFLKETNFDYLDYDMCVSSVETTSNLVERLQKENEELKNLMAHKNWYTQKLEEDLFENASNYVIKKQKIKDKIGWIQEEGYWLFTTDRDSDKCVEILQQLLEKE